MAGVSCKAGTEAIVGLSNPSYNKEGFRILFPGAAASGPSPSNPAFPSPGSLLWEVTFCSILTAGNRRCTQPRKVRVASVPLTSLSSITRVIGGAAALPSRRQPPLPQYRQESSLLRCFTENSRQLGALHKKRTARKWRRSQQRWASETDSSNPRKDPDPRHRRQYRPMLVCKDPLFLWGPSGVDEVPFRSRWRRMNTEKWFREPPPPSLKSS